MGLSEAGHLYKPAPMSWHWFMSKCSSVFASDACWAADGSDEEHPPSANSPSTAIPNNIRFAINLPPIVLIVRATPRMRPEIPPNRPGVSLLSRRVGVKLDFGPIHPAYRKEVCPFRGHKSKMATGTETQPH